MLTKSKNDIALMASNIAEALRNDGIKAEAKGSKIITLFGAFKISQEAEHIEEVYNEFLIPALISEYGIYEFIRSKYKYEFGISFL